MSTATAHGLFRNGFDLVDEAGQVLAVFDGSSWRERGEITAGARTFDFRRRGWRTFALSEGGSEVSTASQRGWLSLTWDVGFAGAAYSLVRGSIWSRALQVRDAAGATLGEIRPTGVFSRAVDVRLPDSLTPELQAFVVAVVVSLWNRQNAAATA